MQKYQHNIALGSGQSVAGARVTVTTLAGAVATLYSDNGTTVTSNPVVTDAQGEFFFYAANGRYTLSISGDGFVSDTETDVLLYDPVDGIEPLAASGGAALVGFIASGTGAVATTVQGKLREQPVSLYDFGGAYEGNCIAAMDAALASGAKVISVPDNVTLGKHVVASTNIKIIGGRNVTFSAAVPAAGFLIGSSGRVEITGFVDAVLAAYPDTGGVINDGHVFVGLAPGAVISELYVTKNSFSGGRAGISAGFESGRTLLKHCEITGNICSGQNGGLGGEGYGVHYANENDTGSACIAFNRVIAAGRHSLYIARNKGGALTVVGNTIVNHRENSTTKGVQARAAIAIFRSSNVTGYGNQVDGFHDSALMLSEETELVATPLNTDNIRLYGTVIKNPKNLIAAIWTGYTDPSPTAITSGVLLDGVAFDSSLNGSQVFQYSWGRGIKIRDLDITYRNLTVGSRMLLLQGNTTANSGGVSIEGVNVHLLNCAGAFTIMRPVPPFATSAMPLTVRDIKVITNTGTATVTDWEPSVTMTNAEIDVFGFSFPTASTALPKQTAFPGLLENLSGSATWDPGSIAVGGRAVFNVTVPGAAFGDFCIPSFSLSLATLSMTASVEALDTVTVCLSNNHTAAVDLASGTLKVLVIKRRS